MTARRTRSGAARSGHRPVGSRSGMMSRMAIQIAQDPVADKVLSEDSFALLIGMLLDQNMA